MGRRRLHDEATASALLEAAERIVEEGGLESLTVRSVAAEVGATTRAVYSTLGSKQALVGALGARAFDMLGTKVGALPLTNDPAADLVAAGTLGFRPFAMQHPALFRLGVQQIAVPAEATRTINTAAARALIPLHLRVSRVQQADSLGTRSLTDATYAFHSLCEGLAAVELRGIIPTSDGHRVWNDALCALISGWRSP
jgi:AcrR family transcriptional regulator